MAIIGITGSAASGGRITNPAPIITYNSFPGIFNITNADVTANYSANSSVTGGTLSFSLNPAGSTVTLSNADSRATIANKSAKGISVSPSAPAERKSFTYSTYTAPPPAQGLCYNYQLPAPGTRYGGNGGYWMAFYGSPYTYLNPAPGYNQAPSEWYKIV